MFYAKLSEAERRHRDLYLILARNEFSATETDERLEVLLVKESEVIDQVEAQFGFFNVL